MWHVEPGDLVGLQELLVTGQDVTKELCMVVKLGFDEEGLPIVVRSYEGRNICFFRWKNLYRPDFEPSILFNDLGFTLYSVKAVNDIDAYCHRRAQPPAS